VVAGHREIDPKSCRAKANLCLMRAVAECRTKLSERPMGLKMRRLLTALRLLLAGCSDKAGNGRALFRCSTNGAPANCSLVPSA
jgi:hypothetical protein